MSQIFRGHFFKATIIYSLESAGWLFSMLTISRQVRSMSSYRADCTALSCMFGSSLEAFCTIVSNDCAGCFSFSSESVLSACGTLRRFSTCSSLLFCRKYKIYISWPLTLTINGWNIWPQIAHYDTLFTIVQCQDAEGVTKIVLYVYEHSTPAISRNLLQGRLSLT